MIRNKIKELIESRNQTVYQFWKDTGVGMSTAYGLTKNPMKIPTGPVLDVICKTYNVQPGDILVYESNKTDVSSVKKISA